MTRNLLPGDQPPDLVVVGRVSGAYGVRGWIRIRAYANQSVLLNKPLTWIGSANQYEPFRIHEVREQGGDLVAGLSDASGQLVTDRDIAAAMKGMELAVARQDFPATGSDEFYWVDLVGCNVVNEAGDDLGRVERLEDHGADPVMILRRPETGGLDESAKQPGAQASRRLIPFVGHYVLDVDLASRTIRVDWDPTWD